MATVEAGPPTISYDHNGADYARRYEAIARELLADKPVAWSDTYDGFWVVSRYADVKRIAENWQLFSSENRAHEGDMTRRGIVVPPLPFPPPLNESDPPVHTRRRMIEAPYFTPKHLRRWQEAAKDYTRLVLDEIVVRGEVELIGELCLRIPAMTTLHVGGVDPHDWELYAHSERYFAGDDAAVYGQVIDRLVAILLERRDHPREDVASALARATVVGEEPMDLRVAAGMLHTIVTGGFDTAMSLLGNALEWLERNPEAREDLRQHPEKMANAVEEFLRQFPPVHHIARNVVADIELGGQMLRAGDQAAEVVHARATPEDKLKIVRAWKARGAIVAMTGDGVNDAPALREAHVGVAMGQGGTEVTREASDMVLADDNFASIVAAVREGRGIFENIRKSLLYLMAGNAGELAVMLGAAVAGLPLPVLPLQILWINLVTDGFPALALVMDPPDRDILKRAPRPPDEPMLGRSEWGLIAAMGLLHAATTLGVFLWALADRDLAEARALAFSTLVFGQIFLSLGFRSRQELLWEVGPFTNLRLLGVIAISGVLQIALMQVPATQRLFRIGDLPPWDILIPILFGLLPLTALEVGKLVRRKRVRRSP